MGAKLVIGDFDNKDALRLATHDMDAVFFTESLTGDWVGDLQRGTNVIEAARASPTVSTMIVSTAFKTGQHETFPSWGPDYTMRQYWLSKQAIESRVRDAGFKHWTIMRPVHFLQNLKASKSSITFPGLAEDRILRVAWKPDTKITWIDAADAGIVVAAALSDPEKYHGKELDLAVEALTVGQLATKLSKALGTDVKVHFLSEEELEELSKQGSPLPAAQQWANEVAGEDALREATGLSLTSVDEFLARNVSQI
ncbi:hypothetical protein PT974_00321 [Cladobotryum mycophilum]|uniref:NmrA-like domain-containing protein n=1 Tax=Cladobotryum mycophilum TaxID=491253 RepID=A0ABR0T0R1_9HYPO